MGNRFIWFTLKKKFYPGFSKDVLWFTPGYLSIQPDAKDDILPNYKLKLFLANYSKRNINKALKQLKNQFYGNLLRT